jgi:hypothetical protein
MLDLIRQLHDQIAPPVLLEVIGEMVSDGVLDKTYRVVDPSMKTMLPEVYRSRSEIPPEVQNNWDHWIIVEPENIRVVLWPAHHG